MTRFSAALVLCRLTALALAAWTLERLVPWAIYGVQALSNGGDREFGWRDFATVMASVGVDVAFAWGLFFRAAWLAGRLTDGVDGPLAAGPARGAAVVILRAAGVVLAASAVSVVVPWVVFALMLRADNLPSEYGWTQVGAVALREGLRLAAAWVCFFRAGALAGVVSVGCGEAEGRAPGPEVAERRDV